MSAHPAEWSYVLSDGAELRLMRLPERRNWYLILIDEDGMHAVARTLGDREATMLVGWLQALAGGGQSDG